MNIPSLPLTRTRPLDGAFVQGVTERNEEGYQNGRLDQTRTKDSYLGSVNRVCQGFALIEGFEECIKALYINLKKDTLNKR